MNKEEFKKQLGIEEEGSENDKGKYIIPLADSDAYSKVYTILDNDKTKGIINLDSTGTLMNDNISQLLYFNEEYDVKLIGDFEKDEYKVIIEESIK